MWPHFVNLLRQSGQNFLTALGTTGLGWWVQGIIWFAATEIATYAVIWGIRGKAAMKSHLAENFRIGFYVWLIVMVCVYGPIFGWHIAEAVYADHETLTAKVAQLQNAPKPTCPNCSTLLSTTTKSPAARLEILYQGSRLNGQTIYLSPNTALGGLFDLAPFHIRNNGDRPTGQVTARLYFKGPAGIPTYGGEWDGSENADEPGFVLAYWCCGTIGERIVNPGETWNWPVFQGRWPKDWPARKPISAKVKFFYGGEKPAVASFELTIKSN